jgi:hypothetical protein
MTSLQQAVAKSFHNLAAWKTSTKGNRCRGWFCGCRLTIFWNARLDGYSWCIADSDGVRYSEIVHLSEEDALKDLGIALGVMG